MKDESGLVELAALTAELAQKSRRQVDRLAARLEAQLLDFSRTQCASMAAISQRVDALENRVAPTLVWSQSEDAMMLRRLIALDAIALTTVREGVKNLPPALWPALASEMGLDPKLLTFAAREFADIERRRGGDSCEGFC